MDRSQSGTESNFRHADHPDYEVVLRLPSSTAGHASYKFLSACMFVISSFAFEPGAESYLSFKAGCLAYRI